VEIIGLMAKNTAAKNTATHRTSDDSGRIDEHTSQCVWTLQRGLESAAARRRGVSGILNLMVYCFGG
jgi:hypothetical protein